MTYDEINAASLRLQLLNQFKPSQGVFVIGHLPAALAAWSIATGNHAAQSTCTVLLLVAGAGFALSSRGRFITWCKELNAEKLRLQLLVQQREAQMAEEEEAARRTRQAKCKPRTGKAKRAAIEQPVDVLGNEPAAVTQEIVIVQSDRCGVE